MARSWLTFFAFALFPCVFSSFPANAARLESVDIRLALPREASDRPALADLQMVLSYRAAAGSRVIGTRNFNEQILIDPLVSVLLGNSSAMPPVGEATSLNSSYRDFDNGTRLSWSCFAPEEQRFQLLITSKVKHALIGTLDANALDFSWLAGWAVPVSLLQVKVIYPLGFKPRRLDGKHDMKPLEQMEGPDGRLIVTFYQEHIPESAAFRGWISFSPGLVRDYGPFRFNRREVGIFLALLLGFVLPAFFFLGKVMAMAGRVSRGARAARNRPKKQQLPMSPELFQLLAESKKNEDEAEDDLSENSGDTGDPDKPDDPPASGR